MADTAADAVRRIGMKLAALGQTGLAFGNSDYDLDRYRQVSALAAELLAVASGHPAAELAAELGRDFGYVTPKVAVGAVVGNDEGQILLVQRSDSGIWLYPTGWADVGYSPAEVAVKEVLEETGIECEVLRLIAVIDGLRMGFTRVPLYSLVFHCKATGGALQRHPLETADVGWFSPDDMPLPIVGLDRWGPAAFAAIRGEPVDVQFDKPRAPVWRGDD